MPDRKRKVFVLGSGRLAGIESGAWFDNLPNLADFDAVVVSTASLNKDLAYKASELEARPKGSEQEADKQKKQIEQQLNEIRSKLARVLATNGTVVAIVHPLHMWFAGKNYWGFPTILRSDGWLPLKVETVEEPGDTLEGEADPVKNYLTKVKSWTHVLKVPDDLGTLGDELNLPDIEVASSVLGQDRQGHPVALRVWAKASGRPGRSGALICLVPPTACSDDEAVSILLADMFGIQTSTPAPEWTQSIQAPGEAEVLTKLQQAHTDLAAAEDNAKRSEGEYDEIRAPVAILDEQHAALHSAVEDVLRRIGFGTPPSPVSDILLEFDGQELLLEVKGHGKSATGRDVSQVNKDVGDYFVREGKSIKGVLVANVWVHDPPEERKAPGKAPFPDDVIQFGKRHHIALLSTQELFDAFCQVAAGDLSPADVFNRLATTDGVVVFKREG